MHGEAEAARFLAAHHGTGLLHLGADVLEANWYLEHFHAVLLAKAVGHRRHVHGLHHRFAQAADLAEVPHEERVERERGDEAPTLVREARAVSVAIHGEPDVGALARDARQELIDVRRDRLGIHPTEVRVTL